MNEINVESPTGCIHRAIDDRFSVPGSRRTLCNHTKPCVGLGWDTYSYHNWPDTTKPVTCKRCLALMEPPITGIRFDFEWKTLPNGVEAVVTRNVWHNDVVMSPPAKSQKFILHAEKNVTGMRGIGEGYVPKMSEETNQWLTAIVRTRYDAIFGDGKTFHWEYCK